jgi:hypothetical protein
MYRCRDSGGYLGLYRYLEQLMNKSQLFSRNSLRVYTKNKAIISIGQKSCHEDNPLDHKKRLLWKRKLRTVSKILSFINHTHQIVKGN